MVPPPATGLVALGLSYAVIHALVAALQGVEAEGVGLELPSLSLDATTWKITTLSLLHRCFICGVVVNGYLPPIWEAVARGRGSIEGLATLN